MELKIFTDIEFVSYLKDTVGDAVHSISKLAAEVNFSNIGFLIIAALLALTVGVFGYRLIKLVSAVGFAAVGYTVGSALFRFLLLQEGMAELPEWLVYVCGGVLALLFFFLGFKKFTYVLFALAYTLFSGVIWDLTGEALLAMGGALILAMVCVFIVRVACVLITSFVGSFLAVGCIGTVLPLVVNTETDMTFLLVNHPENDFGLIVAAGLGVIFAVLQFLFARFYKAE